MDRIEEDRPLGPVEFMNLMACAALALAGVFGVCVFLLSLERVS